MNILLEKSKKEKMLFNFVPQLIFWVLFILLSTAFGYFFLNPHLLHTAIIPLSQYLSSVHSHFVLAGIAFCAFSLALGIKKIAKLTLTVCFKNNICGESYRRDFAEIKAQYDLLKVENKYLTFKLKNLEEHMKIESDKGEFTRKKKAEMS